MNDNILLNLNNAPISIGKIGDNITISISVILTIELNKLKDDNEQMKLRITDLLKDKEFLMNQLQKTF